MASLLVIYKTPKDAAAFDRYYFEKHVPQAKKVPKLRRYEISNGPVGAPGGAPSGVHLIATLTFDSMADIQGAFASPEGQVAAGDIGNFATGGVDILLFDNKTI